MSTLTEIINQGVCLAFLDADPDPEGKLPTGMVVGCHKDMYQVYFQVDGTEDFEYVNSYPVKDYVDQEKMKKLKVGTDLEEILMGAARLAIAINESEVNL